MVASPAPISPAGPAPFCGTDPATRWCPVPRSTRRLAVREATCTPPLRIKKHSSAIATSRETAARRTSRVGGLGTGSSVRVRRCPQPYDVEHSASARHECVAAQRPTRPRCNAPKCDSPAKPLAHLHGPTGHDRIVAWAQQATTSWNRPAALDVIDVSTPCTWGEGERRCADHIGFWRA